jgi:hypothetical protein
LLYPANPSPSTCEILMPPEIPALNPCPFIAGKEKSINKSEIILAPFRPGNVEKNTFGICTDLLSLSHAEQGILLSAVFIGVRLALTEPAVKHDPDNKIIGNTQMNSVMISSTIIAGLHPEP